MKNSDSLYKLIHSLSGSEKRYLKLFSSLQKGEKEYLKLFDAVEKQQEYNEEKLLEELKQERFVSYFSDAKKRLYNHILKVLEIYYADYDVNSQLASRIRQITILYKKGLYNESEKLLLKAKYLAEKYEKYESLIQLLKWERDIVVKSKQHTNFEHRVNKIYAERNGVANKMENSNMYQQLADKIYVLSIIKGEIRNEDEMQAFENIMSHPLLQDENKAVTKRAKLLFYHIHHVYNAKKGNKTESYNYSKKTVEMFGSSPEHIHDAPSAYLDRMQNFARLCYLTEKYDELAAVLKKIRHLPEMLGSKCSEEIKVKVFEGSYNIELSMYITSCEFEKGASIVSDIEKGMDKFKGKMRNEYEIIFYINCSLVYFIGLDYHQALMWNNKIVNDDTNIRQDVYCSARILNLLIHYELGNEDILENLVKSTERYLDNKTRLYKTETAFLNFIRKKVPVAFTVKERVVAFKELKAELEGITKDTLEKNVLKDIDYIAWVESKIEGKSFADVLREQLHLRKTNESTNLRT